MKTSVQQHFQYRYPSATHNFLPSQVNLGKILGNEGSIDIDAKGIGRAYHDVTIKPVRKQALTIPIHQSAFYRRAVSFNNLFAINSNGKGYLAMNSNGNIVLMYRLAKSAFQKKDSSIMPSDSVLADSIFKRICDDLDNI